MSAKGASPVLAEQFIKRMVDDLIAPKDQMQTMGQLVDHLFKQKDDNGKPVPFEQARVAAADKLIGSLNALSRDGDISPKLQEHIKGIFQDPALTSSSDIADKLKDQREMNTFWMLAQQSDTTFNFSYNRDQIGYVRDFFNALTPGLGDLMANVMGIRAEDPKEAAMARNNLAAGFDAMHRGQVSMGGFLGQEKKTDPVTKEPVPFDVWNGPGNREEWTQFFGAGMMAAGATTPSQYQFYDSSGKVYTQSFESMVLQEWEDDGIVQFADPQARADFIAFTKQQVLGGELDSSFSQQLIDKELVSFDGPEDRAQFDTFLGALDVRFKDEAMIADAIVEYASDRDGVDVKYTAGAGIRDVANNYVPARNGNEYANNMMEFAEQHPGIVITNMDAGMRTPSIPMGPAAGTSPPLASLPVEDYTDFSDGIEVKIDDSGKAQAIIDGANVSAFQLMDEVDLYSLKVLDADGNGKGEVTFDVEHSDLSPADLKARLGGNEFALEEVAHHETDTVIGYKIAGTDLYLGANALKDRAAEFNDANRVSRESAAVNSPAAQQAQDLTVQMPGNSP